MPVVSKSTVTAMLGYWLFLNCLITCKIFFFVSAGGFAGNFHNRIIGDTVGLINITKSIDNAIGVVIIDSKNQCLFAAFRIQVIGYFL